MNFIQHRSVLCAPALEGVKDELAVLSNVPPGLPGSYWLARPTEGRRYNGLPLGWFPNRQITPLFQAQNLPAAGRAKALADVSQSLLRRAIN